MESIASGAPVKWIKRERDSLPSVLQQLVIPVYNNFDYVFTILCHICIRYHKYSPPSLTYY